MCVDLPTEELNLHPVHCFAYYHRTFFLRSAARLLICATVVSMKYSLCFIALQTALQMKEQLAAGVLEADTPKCFFPPENLHRLIPSA